MSARVLISILGSRFYAFKDNCHNRISQAGEVIIAVPVAIRKDPRGYYLIHRAKEAVGRDGNRNVGPKNARFLAFPQHSFNHIKIFHQKIMRKLAKKLGTMPEFGLEDNSQAAV